MTTYSLSSLCSRPHIREEIFPRRTEVLSEVNFDLVALTSGGQTAPERLLHSCPTVFHYSESGKIELKEKEGRAKSDF